MESRDVAFVLFPQFSMIALYGALEPLRIANRFAGAKVFTWHFASVDGEPVAASNDIPVSVASPLNRLGTPDLAIFCASYEQEKALTRPVIAEVRRLARRKVLLGGMDTGPFILAEAGALDGCRATCHWESLPGFRERYPAVKATQSLFENDGGRLTSAGGAAAIDMMLDWIGRLHGSALAVKVADQLVHFRRPETHAEDGRLPAAMRYGVTDPRLLKIIGLMEDNLEEPLDVAALAEAGGLSVRHVERLFQDSLGERPIGFYGKLRLERAQHLLNYSRMSVRDTSLAVGYSSLAQFSRAFKARYGIPPSRLLRG